MELEVISKAIRTVLFMRLVSGGNNCRFREHSHSLANEIAMEAALIFGIVNWENIVVDFKTAEQVMGEVN